MFSWSARGEQFHSAQSQLACSNWDRTHRCWWDAGLTAHDENHISQGLRCHRNALGITSGQSELGRKGERNALSLHQACFTLGESTATSRKMRGTWGFQITHARENIDGHSFADEKAALQPRSQLQGYEGSCRELPALSRERKTGTQ